MWLMIEEKWKEEGKTGDLPTERRPLVVLEGGLVGN